MNRNRYKIDLKNILMKGSFPEDAAYIDKMFKNREIVIYGAGECSHWFFEVVMKMYGYKPTAVLDRVLHKGQDIYGIPAFSPDEYHVSDREFESKVAVICVGKKVHHGEIVRKLKAIGFKEIIYLMDIYEIHNPFNLPVALSQNGFQFYSDNTNEILKAVDLFEDKMSLEVYTSCIKTHIQRKPVPIPDSPREEQYFPKDIQLKKGYSDVINCGAYDGDTIKLLNKNQGKVSTVFCFEPEQKIFSRLTKYLMKENNSIANEVVAFPCAVCDKEAMMPFISSDGLGSRISETGDSFVQGISLDGVLPGFKPTFICMDIEGMEKMALKGAESILRKQQPDLAVCVYHNPSHLWEIPLYLNSLKVGYKFHLRNYTSFTYETVLYAST